MSAVRFPKVTLTFILIHNFIRLCYIFRVYNIRCIFIACYNSILFFEKKSKLVEKFSMLYHAAYDKSWNFSVFLLAKKKLKSDH